MLNWHRTLCDLSLSPHNSKLNRFQYVIVLLKHSVFIRCNTSTVEPRSLVILLTPTVVGDSCIYMFDR